jgi:hypothetical protein
VARRKELNNIASGLYGSFISRNNDVGGYWGVGKLCLLAQQHETNIVRLNLLAESISPVSAEFSRLVAGYHTFLQKHLTARHIPKKWVTSAIIELDFKVVYPLGKRIPIVTWGSLFKLTVTITDDMSKNHTITGYSYCGPHSQKKESKSAGADRF